MHTPLMQPVDSINTKKQALSLKHKNGKRSFSHTDDLQKTLQITQGKLFKGDY